MTRPDAVVFQPVDADFQHHPGISGVPFLYSAQQAPSDHEQVRQSTGNKQPVCVFIQPPVADLAESKDPLDDQEGMLTLGAHLRLGAILGALLITQWTVATALLVRKVARIRRVFSKGLTLTGIGRVAQTRVSSPLRQTGNISL